MFRVMWCIGLVACGTAAPRDAPPALAPGAAASPASSDPAPAASEVTKTAPWAMPAGRIGRLRVVRGETVAVFGAEDPRFVGRLGMEDNYGDNWMETKIVPAGAHAAPRDVLGVPLDPDRPALALVLGDAIEVRDVYAGQLGGDPDRDELAARGFRVTKCGNAPPDFRTCDEGDLVIIGPTRTVPVPAAPTAPAPEAVRTAYEHARNGGAPGVRSVVLDARLGLHWATEDSDRQTGSLVWTSAPSEHGSFVYRVRPRALRVAGDAFLVFSLDEPLREEIKRRIRVHQFRAGNEPITYEIRARD